MLHRKFKRSVVEGFEGNTIDFEALDNLATIAGKLNKGEDFEFPGSLTVKGKLTVEDDINANKSLHFNKSKEGGGYDLHTTLRLGKSDEKVSDGFYDDSDDFVIDKKEKDKGHIRLQNRTKIVNPQSSAITGGEKGTGGGAKHVTLALENASKGTANQLGFFSTRQWGGIGMHLGDSVNDLGLDGW
jgi:hypothetical protein